MKHRLLIAGFAFLLIASFGMGLYHPGDARAAATYILHDNSVELRITITGPVVPDSSKQVTFTYQGSGTYAYDSGGDIGNGHNCTYDLQTANGKARDTKGKIVPI